MSHPEPDCDDNPARWEYARLWGEAEGAALFRPTGAAKRAKCHCIPTLSPSIAACSTSVMETISIGTWPATHEESQSLSFMEGHVPIDMVSITDVEHAAME